ncbi:MAG: hypothetical protein ACXVH6_05890 [Halobacteriota archaeon]
MLKLPGNRLLLAYGGIGHGNDTKQDYEKLRDWLVDEKDRYLTLIFGIWGTYIDADATYNGDVVSHQGKRLRFQPRDKEIDKMRETLKKIFDFSKLPVDVVDRLHVYGIANFHPKVMYLSRKDRATGKDEWPVALQFGSSNFTGAARRKAEAFQYEMDLFLRWDCPEHRSLIKHFVTQWKVLHATSGKYDVGEFNMDLFFETFGEALKRNDRAQWKQWSEEWETEYEWLL